MPMQPIELQRPATSHAPDERGTTLGLSGASWPPLSPRQSIPMSYRPSSSPTRPLSATTFNSTRKPKYGLGKYAATELVPQPSDDPIDPLNWPRWRKELNFIALLFMVGIVNSTKTAFLTVNAEIATTYPVSYAAAASLTAIPLMVSALTNISSSIAARVVGKRPVYLASAALLLIGCIWATLTESAFVDCMGARVLQGLGWGAFDALALGSIQDTFFEHERHARRATYHILAVGTTWGPPFLGGLIPSKNFTSQFVVISALWVLALPLIVFGAPETAFTRRTDNLIDWQPRSQSLKQSDRQHSGSAGDSYWDKTKQYLLQMHPAPYRGKCSLRTVLQTMRSAIAPTVLFVVAVSFLPYCLLWAFSQTLGLLFSGLPFRRSPGALGLLMAGPFVLGTVATAGLSIWRRFQDRFTKQTNLAAIGLGTGLAAVSAIAYGLMVSAPGQGISTPRHWLEAHFSFPVLSVLLGLLAVGSVTLMATGWPLVAQSAQYTAFSLPDCAQRTADMSASVTAWLALLAGIFIMVTPGAIGVVGGDANGLRATVLGLGATQLGISVCAVVVWVACGDQVRRWDGHIIGRADHGERRRTQSFFDHDY